MKQLKNKSSRSQYSENYYRNNPNTRKSQTASNSFNFEEFLQIAGLWFYEKSRKYFEGEKV